MKRSILTALLAASIPLVLSQEPSPTSEEPVQTAPAPGKNPANLTAELAISLATQTFDSIKAATDILQKVKDKPTADAAAPEIAQLGSRIQQLQQQAEQWGEPDEEVEQALMDHFEAQEEELRTMFQSFMSIIFPLISVDPPCYGSSALQEALKPLGLWGNEEGQE